MGFILLLIELLTPGFGIPGISGIILIILGCYYAYLKLNLFWAIFTTVISVLAVIGFFKILTRSLVWKRIRLDSKETKDKGFTSTDDFSGLLNKTGITLTTLRPTGVAIIEGKRIDVIAEEGMFINKDKKIKVIRIEGNKVIVKEES